MKITKEMLKKAHEVIDEMELEENYEFIGIRVQDVPFELGEMNHVSSVWVDGDETEETLNGVCATSINALDNFGSHVDTYYGNYVAIICGNTATSGEDLGEIIIEDAEAKFIF